MTTTVNLSVSDAGPEADRDPDYDELWGLVFKLDTILTSLIVAGASIDEALALAGATDEEVAALRFSARDRAVLAAVGRDREIIPA